MTILAAPTYKPQGTVRKTLLGLVAQAATIRGRIWVAFALTAIITCCLGTFAGIGIDRAGGLAEKTYNQSLMSISFARAASSDFLGMELAVARLGQTNDPQVRAQLEQKIADLDKSLVEDLTIAAERSQSARVGKAAARALAAVRAWHDGRSQAPDAGANENTWDLLDTYAATVGREIELLVNYTAGDGFLYRQKARQIVAQDMQINLIGTGLALCLCLITAWFLGRRVTGAVASASDFAERIAGGDLDGAAPARSDDELGDLIASMSVMRDRIREMMQGEVAQRQSAQARLADALEGSQAGIVMIDVDGKIAIANTQVVDFFSDSTQLPRPGTKFADLTGVMARAIASSTNASVEVKLADQRWIRVTRSQTHDGGFVAVCNDVSELKAQASRLRETNQNLDVALANMSQGLCMFDSEDHLRVFNKRLCDIFRLPADEVKPGITLRQMIEMSIAAGNHPGETVEDQLALHTQLMVARPGEVRFLQMSDERIAAVVHQPLSGGGWVASYEDVTESKRAENRIIFMARHDALTGLPNRLLLGESVETAIAHLGRGRGFALLCLDLDQFKEVNDTLGHPAGDELLREVAVRLQSCVSEIDTVCRLGGDEFAIVQSALSSPEDAAILARRIVQTLAIPFQLHGREVTIGVSVGIATAPSDGSDFRKLLKSADAALYSAKESGRGIWRFFDPEMESRQQERRKLESDLRHALGNDEFEVFFQPLYEISTRRIGGFEALLRWRHPERGLVGPSDFISICEETGLIVPIGAWVLSQACLEASRWPDDLKVAVNVSAIQFRSADLIDNVKLALQMSGLPAHRLELEVTESVLLTNREATLDVLHRLRSLGCNISMDDFGTGYSSLSYLRKFPFDKIKIDRSFVRDIDQPDSSAVIVKAILGLGKSLRVRVTAEGVETREQLEWLRAEGCDQIQGYLISPPVPADKAMDQYEYWNSHSPWAGAGGPVIDVTVNT